MMGKLSACIVEDACSREWRIAKGITVETEEGKPMKG
jgi:hypothetical protein